MFRIVRSSLVVCALLVCLFSVGNAQSTALTYQGQLQNAGSPASGNFDFEFALFDNGGSQIGPVLTRTAVSVANGVFSVDLDFGSSFPGATRFLEIRVRQGSLGGFTTLNPRQPVTSSPYSVKSLTADTATNASNATNATNSVNATNAVTAANFTGDLSGDVTGTQGATTVARLQGRSVANTQPTSGQVLKFNGTQWVPDTDNTGGSGGGGTITGVTAGTGLTGGGTTGSVTLGIANAGVNTTQLADNSVTDAKIAGVAGAKVTGTVANATNASTATNATQLGGIPSDGFVKNQTTQQPNSNFYISGDGRAGGTLTADTVGVLGSYNLGGIPVLRSENGNLFVGGVAGVDNTSGSDNVFLGGVAGTRNRTGSGNTAVGSFADLGSINLTNATAIGTRAQVNQSNSMVLGSIAGINFATSSVNVGIGTPTPNSRLDIAATGNGAELLRLSTERPWVFRQVNTGGSAGLQLLSTTGVKQFEITALGGTNVATFVADDANPRVGIGTTTPSASARLDINGTARVILATGGSQNMCLSVTGFIASCSSSLRYKTHVRPFFASLDLIKRLRPITFDWKDGGMHDLGLGAEDVAAIEPLLVTYNSKGEVEGVKYDRIAVVLVNAVKEQQAQIESQQKIIETQQKQLEQQGSEIGALKRIICSIRPGEELCLP